MISKARPPAVIYAFPHVAWGARRTHLFWGVQPMPCRQALSAEQMVNVAERDLLRQGVLKSGDVLGVVAGTRQASGSTNFLPLHTLTAQEASPNPPPPQPFTSPPPH